MSQWVKGTVIENKQWHPSLFSLRIATPMFDFNPGQFVRLGVEETDQAGETSLLHRAYSLVNPPGTDYIELFITAVEGGEVSPHMRQLQSGDEVQVSQPASGFFTIEHIPNADSLWMIGTGTGLGPYLSMLQSSGVWERFQHIVLVHAVREEKDLAYQDTMSKLSQAYPGRFTYQAVVSREQTSSALLGRVPALIRSGQLEQQVGIPLNEQAQVMLCGNPGMIHDTRTLLAERGMPLNLRRKPGNVTLEQYWQK